MPHKCGNRQHRQKKRKPDGGLIHLRQNFFVEENESNDDGQSHGKSKDLCRGGPGHSGILSHSDESAVIREHLDQHIGRMDTRVAYEDGEPYASYSKARKHQLRLKAQEGSVGFYALTGLDPQRFREQTSSAC